MHQAVRITPKQDKSNKETKIMTIYVLYYCNFQGDEEYKGAFSTYEKAQAIVNRFGAQDRDSFRICEEQLDDY